jgi:hypothetical protein
MQLVYTVMREFIPPLQFSSTDDKPNTTVDVCVENALELSIRATLKLISYYNKHLGLILNQVRQIQQPRSTGNPRASDHRDSEPADFVMTGALPVGTQEITQTVDHENDEEQIVTRRPQRTSRKTVVDQPVISEAESDNVAEPRHKTAFKDTLSSLPSRIKLFSTACPFDHHGFLEFRANSQYVQYDRETQAFALTKLFRYRKPGSSTTEVGRIREAT